MSLSNGESSSAPYVASPADDNVSIPEVGSCDIGEGGGDPICRLLLIFDDMADEILDMITFLSKKRRTISEDIESNDKVGNEINASVAISLLDDEIVFSEEDFRHMDEPAEKNRCLAQKRPAKKFHKDDLAIRPPHELGLVSIRDKMWWYILKQVATPLNTMVKSMNGKFGADSNSVDKLSPLIVYTSGHNNRFNYNWEEVDHVFIPVFMDKKAHWILVDLDMSNLHLDVYNSSFKTIRDVAVLDVVEPLRQMILHIICHSKVLTRDIPVCQSHCARIFHIKQMGE
ncbi:Uncharacterized protein Fot_22828 [Forsythia ovata]|uniref:Ubiquitin-like protease family profile domain-containing protein n=1 Tax=Forsythia ovata TaxID=205694 RepID=A0ABD1UZ56_9LAMI